MFAKSPKTFLKSVLAACAVAGFMAATPLPAAAQDNAEFSPDQTKAIRTIMRDYLMENPEIIGEAINALREKSLLAAENEAKRALETYAPEIFEDSDTPAAGNLKGDVTIVEFFDYRCTYCKSMSDRLFDLAKADGKIRLVFKEFPILGPDSLIAARAALASHEQKKYAVFHRALMNVQGPLNEAVIFKTASNAGLDVARLKKDMASAKIDKALEKNNDLARRLQISSTPVFIIEDKIIPQAVPEQVLKHLVDQARKAKNG